MHTLTSLFEKLGLNEIDFLSLDIEGYEVQALRGLNLERYRPKVMIIESDDEEHEMQIDALILPFGYQKSINLEKNIFYLADPHMERALKSNKFKVHLLHTEHPMDKTGDKIVSQTLDFRQKNRWLAKIMKRLSCYV